MAVPTLYEHITPGLIESLRFWSWTVDVQRGIPYSDDPVPVVLRDSQGQPVERWVAVAVHTALPAAIYPPSPREQELFLQQGISITHVAVFKRLTPSGALPDVRHKDRLIFPTDGSRYLEVQTTQDVGEASLLLLCGCLERRPGSG